MGKEDGRGSKKEGSRAEGMSEGKERKGERGEETKDKRKRKDKSVNDAH